MKNKGLSVEIMDSVCIKDKKIISITVYNNRYYNFESYAEL